MTTDSTPFTSPIDALSLIHHALRMEAERAEQTVEHLEVGSSFKVFHPAFYYWALVLNTYVETEARVLPALAPEVAHAWDHTAGTAQQLLARLDALQAYLQTALSKTLVIARTRRQLWSQVALARLVQEDLIEDEEASLLPVLRTRLTAARQWEVLRLLLLDQDAAPQDTMVVWITPDVTEPEREILVTLTTRFVSAANGASLPLGLASCQVPGSPYAFSPQGGHA